MKVISLISPGIDSPVASDIMIKKGLELVGVHCASDWDSRSIDLTRRMCKKVGIKKLYVINHGTLIQEVLKDSCTSGLVCVHCKRFMLRIAERIAKIESAEAIVTGDNLGQVASQTLTNMQIISSSIQLPILRPILCNDKQETVDIAKEIGTFEIGLDSPPCCEFVPHSPATKASIDKVLKDEQSIKLDDMLSDAVKTAKIITID